LTIRDPPGEARSGSGISAIFASTSLSPSALLLLARASAFSSLARSFIAAFSSSVNPLDFLPLAVVFLSWFMRISFHLLELVCLRTPRQKL
jgi:hypothetical protein